MKNFQLIINYIKFEPGVFKKHTILKFYSKIVKNCKGSEDKKHKTIKFIKIMTNNFLFPYFTFTP